MIGKRKPQTFAGMGLGWAAVIDLHRERPENNPTAGTTRRPYCEVGNTLYHSCVQEVKTLQGREHGAFKIATIKDVAILLLLGRTRTCT